MIVSQGACFCMYFWLVVAGLIDVCGRRHCQIVGSQLVPHPTFQGQVQLFPKRLNFITVVRNARLYGRCVHNVQFRFCCIQRHVFITRAVRTRVFLVFALACREGLRLIIFFPGSYVSFVPDPHRTYRFDHLPILRTLFLGAVGVIPHSPSTAAVTQARCSASLLSNSRTGCHTSEWFNASVLSLQPFLWVRSRLYVNSALFRCAIHVVFAIRLSLFPSQFPFFFCTLGRSFPHRQWILFGYLVSGISTDLSLISKNVSNKSHSE